MKKIFQTQSSIDKHVEAGRGTGHGVDYKPWLEIHHISSLGKSSRINGWKTNRIHQLLSQLELHYFYILEWNEEITDIREQFPLLPQADTLTLAEKLGIKHPQEPKAECPMVMTTDFVFTDSKGEHARSVKPAKELERLRTIEKLELERIYWEAKGIDWKIVTEHEIDTNLAKSIEWIHQKRFVEDLSPITSHEVHRARIHMESKIGKGLQTRLTDLCSVCDETLGFVDGNALSIARHLIATKVWIVPMIPKLTPNRSIEITINENYDKQSLRVG